MTVKSVNQQELLNASGLTTTSVLSTGCLHPACLDLQHRCLQPVTGWHKHALNMSRQARCSVAPWFSQRMTASMVETKAKCLLHRLFDSPGLRNWGSIGCIRMTYPTGMTSPMPGRVSVVKGHRNDRIYTTQTFVLTPVSQPAKHM